LLPVCRRDEYSACRRLMVRVCGDPHQFGGFR
jgi:hypothetical protein